MPRSKKPDMATPTERTVRGTTPPKLHTQTAANLHSTKGRPWSPARRQAQAKLRSSPEIHEIGPATKLISVGALAQRLKIPVASAKAHLVALGIPTTRIHDDDFFSLMGYELGVLANLTPPILRQGINALLTERCDKLPPGFSGYRLDPFKTIARWLCTLNTVGDHPLSYMLSGTPKTPPHAVEHLGMLLVLGAVLYEGSTLIELRRRLVILSKRYLRAMAPHIAQARKDATDDNDGDIDADLDPDTYAKSALGGYKLNVESPQEERDS